MSGNYPSSEERDLKRIIRSVRDLFEGRSNAFGTFTCALSQATTTVPAPNCATASEVFLQALTANAAAEVGNGTIYVSAKAQGSFTVTHSNSAVSGRSFAYRIGG